MTIMLALANTAKAGILEPLSLSINQGEIICIVGPSGCGKTTLLNLVAGLDKPTSGQLYNEATATAYMFQEDRLLPWETVFGNIALVGGKDGVGELIQKVGLSGYEGALPAKLSGGMKKRCAFARALHYKAPLLLLDEPFRSLDPKLRQDMCQLLLQTWSQNKQTVLLVTHDMDEALMLGHKVVVLSQSPAKIKGILELPVPHGQRSLDHSEMGAVRGRLARLMLEESRCES